MTKPQKMKATLGDALAYRTFDRQMGEWARHPERFRLVCPYPDHDALEVPHDHEIVRVAPRSRMPEHIMFVSTVIPMWPRDPDAFGDDKNAAHPEG